MNQYNPTSFEKLLIFLGLTTLVDLEMDHGIFRCGRCKKIHHIPKLYCDTCDEIVDRYKDTSVVV